MSRVSAETLAAAVIVSLVAVASASGQDSGTLGGVGASDVAAKAAAVRGAEENAPAESQGEVIIVPLPPMAYAGLATLGGVAAGAYWRRRRMNRTV